MDEYIAQDRQLWGAVYPAFMESLKFRGKQLGFPDQAQVATMYWNVDMFNQAGLDPERAPTFEELELYAAKLTKRRGDGKFDTLGFNPLNTWAGFQDWAYFFGGQLFDRKTEKVTANSEINLKALQWLSDFTKKYDGPTKLWSMGLFEQGKVAMLVGQQYIMKNIAASKKKVKFMIGLPPIPGGLSATKGPLAGLDCNIVLRGSKHPAEAYQFMKYFISRGGWMRPDTPDPSPYRVMNEKFTPPSIVPEGTWKSVILKVLEYARPSLSMPGVEKYKADLEKAIEQVHLGKKSPQQALSEAQASGEKHLAEALKRARWGK